MNQRGNILIFILLGVVILTTVIGIYILKNLNSIPNTSTSIPPQVCNGSVASCTIGSWKTYQTYNNSQYYFRFTYPIGTVIDNSKTYSQMPDLLSYITLNTPSSIDTQYQNIVSLEFIVWSNKGVNVTDIGSLKQWMDLISPEVRQASPKASSGISPNFPVNVQKVYIGGSLLYTAFKASNGLAVQYDDWYYIPHGNYIYQLIIPTGEPGPQGSTDYFKLPSQILNTFEFNNQNQTLSPTSTCMPRPACLDATPRCLIPEPSSGWCK